MRLVLAVVATIGVSLVPLAARAQALSLPASGVVVIDVTRGPVQVTGWERAELSLEGNSAHEAIRTASGAQVRRVRGRDGDDQVLHVRVPRAFRIVLNGSSNDVAIRDIQGDVEVVVNSGDVVMERIGGRVRVTGIRGDIGLTDVANGVEATTASGDVIMQNVRGNVHVTTTVGDVVLTESRVQRLTVETMNGDVVFRGSLPEAARSTVETHFGDVRLELAPDARALVEMQSFAGSIASQLPLVLLPGRGDRGSDKVQRLQVGREGGPVISISTFSGDIEIVRIGARNNN